MDSDSQAAPAAAQAGHRHATLVLPGSESGDCCSGGDQHSHHHHHHHHHHEDDGALSDDEKPGEGADEEDADDDPAHRIVVPADVTTITADTEAIEWVGTVGQKITILDGLQVCGSKLKSLNLRSNLLRRMLGVRHCSSSSLVYLELYDNRIEALEDVEGLASLEVLDISYNRIRDLFGIDAEGKTAARPYYSSSSSGGGGGSDAAGQGEARGMIGCLANLRELRELFIASNKLVSSFGLQNCTKLTRLDLGNNKIRKIEGLETLVNLRELWLGKNKIKRIEGLDTLVNLEKLDVQSNRLESIGAGALKALTGLKELYLGHNGIKSIKPEELGTHLKKLSTLDLSGNQIESLEGSGLDQCDALTDLWVSQMSQMEGGTEKGSKMPGGGLFIVVSLILSCLLPFLICSWVTTRSRLGRALRTWGATSRTSGSSISSTTPSPRSGSTASSSSAPSPSSLRLTPSKSDPAPLPRLLLRQEGQEEQGPRGRAF